MEQHQHLQLHRHPEGVHHCSSALLVHDLQVCRRGEPPADEKRRGWTKQGASWARSGVSAVASRSLGHGVGVFARSRALGPDVNFSWVLFVRIEVRVRTQVSGARIYII